MWTYLKCRLYLDSSILQHALCVYIVHLGKACECLEVHAFFLSMTASQLGRESIAILNQRASISCISSEGFRYI